MLHFLCMFGHTVNFLIAATLYFAAALPELAPHAKFEFWILLGYYLGMRGFNKFHQISLLCYHQELACTPKDPPRRVDMNERSLIYFCKQND